MPYMSMIMVTANNKTANETARLWIDRRCVEEAAETIPGFQRGEVLVQEGADNKICVLCVWNKKSDYDAWLKSPVREKQGEDITPILSAEVSTICFERVHEVDKET